jgi:molecular chaperone Hsp33
VSEASERATPNSVEVRSDYIRGRDVLLVTAELAPIFVDCGLHLLQNGHRLERAQERMLHDALAVMTLHLCSRPRDELSAWTINLRDPPLNVFATGDSQRGWVCGRVFTRDVKVGEKSRLIAQTSRPRIPMRQSAVAVEGQDVLSIAEQYYRQSEQLPARFFRLDDEEFAMAVAHPDYDALWFEALDVAGLRALPEREELGPIERRVYHFGCGCDEAMILTLLARATGGDLDGLFEDDDELRTECQRCASVYRISRERMERFLAERDAPPSQGPPPSGGEPPPPA